MPVWNNDRTLLKQRITFVSRGELFRTQLNKDYRWVEYWKNIEESLWEEKCNKWKNYLGAAERFSNFKNVSKSRNSIGKKTV